MSTTPKATIPRRHDLDALRAIAMLLGIFLHGAASFIPGAWEIQDSQQSEFLYLPLALIHGFRMHVFFIMSGFFTAMLWRKRGLGSLLKQRFKRVFLPLALGMVTIMPLTIGAFVFAFILSPPANIWQAAARGDVTALIEFRNAGENVNTANEEGWTPLHSAAAEGHVEAVDWLIDNGAYVNATHSDEYTPLDLAGDHPEVASLLHARGGRTSARATAEQHDVSDLTKTELFGHLWFLWHLCWLVVGFAIVVKVAGWLGLKKPAEKWVLSGRRYLWLVPLTMIFQAGMIFPSYGPDTSTGLLPMPHVLLYYAIFFGFGALYFHYDTVERERGWKKKMLFALVIFFAGLIFTFGAEEEGLSTWTLPAVFFQALFPWVMSFSLMALFQARFSTESYRMRYISDSSYWLYLAHIAVLVILQGLMSSWAIPALIKFTLLCGVTTVVLLYTYEHWVRYRWIGRFLNGPRQRPPKDQPPPPPTGQLVAQAGD